MRIARFEPWSYIDLLNRDLGRAAAEDSARAWSPAVDILEEKDSFLLRADLPGVNPTDIDISMDGGVLTVSGVRLAEERGEDTAVQRVERSTGKFSRRFTLPETVDADGITAKHSNGILEVIIPKQPEMKARKVTVEAT
ncbi:MAG: Hsp20/alpha crystallin family protein [Gammaproteobacteria bacterium]|jgi:HSP20 family protein|nr:Hsp20/alpha crystallin family protein [Gammaproteobacteria bacterium]MDH5242253.1 Hsp20/alpha crystallin family protein [Gammaproteobacteria bacterium]MDH5261520.1 Hsp20/alpha crystallin family protein [Gammaproteobacteria bacterium]MDH5583302.1 Hsp20/alpha crystallin family protein [Gammaproteobacteria bacterium]